MQIFYLTDLHHEALYKTTDAHSSRMIRPITDMAQGGIVRVPQSSEVRPTSTCPRMGRIYCIYNECRELYVPNRLSCL